jgi:choline dehydrogenase-like flavoprotein
MPKSTPQFDVCVIGSGAAGGVMARELSEGGAKVVLLEAGSEVPPSDFLSHKWPYELPYRGFRDEKQAPFYQGDVVQSIRYVDSDGIGVDRIRVVGGRTVHWNAVVLRYAARDFRLHSTDGVGEDWPLTYEELGPYYERIEQMIGVCGSDDGLEILPGGKHYLPPLPWRCSERILHRALKQMNVPLIDVRKAVLTKPYDGRPPCHYCGHCMDGGCDVSALFSSATAMIPKARATGNFTLRQNASAREILVNDEGRASGVSFVDTTRNQEETISARIVVVCCASIESARLLLNSRSPRHPNGLANSNDVVGRYLHGHLGGGMQMYLDELEGVKPFNQDGATDHVFIPRYNQLFGKRDYSGGWDIQVNFDSYMFPYQAAKIPGYGADFKAQVRRMQPALLQMGTFGTVLARPENRVTVDSNHPDAHGIPIPVVRFRFGENDLKLWRDSVSSLQEICSHMKGQVFIDSSARPGGFASHEVGTIRMGSDPKTSVLNSYCQAHEVKNLFVTDGSTFTASSEKNPTLTIMALSLRAADYIKEQRRRGEL